MKKIQLFLYLILTSFILSNCSGSADTVTLIPFAGALTPLTDSAIENGFSSSLDAPRNLTRLLSQKNIGESLMEEWELFSEVDGASIGSVSRDVTACSNPVNLSCTMPVTLSFDDGSSVSANTPFFCFPFEFADIDPACDPQEPGSQLITLSCIGSATIESGAGIYSPQVDKGTINYVGLEERVVHQDGTHTFCKSIRSVWEIHQAEL